MDFIALKKNLNNFANNFWTPIIVDDMQLFHCIAKEKGAFKICV